MDLERSFLNLVLDEEDFSKAVSFGITDEVFTDPENAEIWGAIASYYERYNRSPTLDAIEEVTGLRLKPLDVAEPVEFLCEQLHLQRSYSVVVDTLKGAKKALQDDPVAAVERLREGVELLDQGHGAAHVPLVDIHVDWTTWLDEYWSRQLVGIPTGFPTIDYATGGYQPQQLVTVVGPPKAGKSTLLLQLGYHANVVHGLRVAMWTFEMSVDEQRLRLACMIAKTDYQRMLNRTAAPKEFQRVRRVLDRLEDVTPGFFMFQDTSGGTTVGQVQQQIRRLDREGQRPHLVIVDGVYLMESGVPNVEGMDPKALTALTRNLKRLGQNENLPVLISHQVLESRYSMKKGIKSRSIGYSSSFAQDSDTILGVEDTEDEKQRRLSIVLARNAAKRACTLEWDWETSTMEEIDAPTDDDEGDDFFDRLDDDDD